VRLSLPHDYDDGVAIITLLQRMVSFSALPANALSRVRFSVCRLDITGFPSAQSIYIFNGDFVDRGAWGMETLILMCALKLAQPQHVYLLRGNHETITCTMQYGFKGELVAKYGKTSWKVRARK
jgi:hypothetical protein